MGDLVGAAVGCLRDDDPAHAVADENGAFGPLCECRAHALGVRVERDVFQGCLVVAATRQVGRLHRVARGLERADDRLPAPGTGERAVDEDEASHQSIVSTNLPCVRPVSPASCARPASSSGNVCDDVRAQFARLDEPGDRLQAGPVGLDEDAGHAHPFARELLERLEARCRRNDDEETAVSQRSERAGGGLAADEVEHDVDVADGLLDRAEAVVDRLVGAQLGEEPVLGRTGRADHVRAARLRDLHGEMADATCGSQHEHALSGLNVGRLDQRLPRRQPGERKRGGLDVGEPLGYAGELARGRSHVLRVGGCFTGEARHSEDPVPHRESRGAEAQSLHRAGDVPADGERRLAE